MVSVISLPSPRFVLIHSDKESVRAETTDPHAHAFGPFENYDALVEFDKRMPEDTCYRFAFPLVGPEMEDVMLTSLGVAMGVRLAALSLPPRGDVPVERDAPSLDATLIALQKRIRKEAKRAAKRDAKAKQDEIDKANAQDDGR